MNWMQAIWKSINNRRVLPWVALGVGVTALGITQRRRWNGGNLLSRIMQPLRKAMR